MSAFLVNNYATSSSSSAGSLPLSPAISRPSAPDSDSNDVSQPFQAAPTAAPAPTLPLEAAAPITQQKSVEEKAKLDKAVDTINQFLKPIASSVQFSVDEDSGRTLVKVIDTDTNSVLRQFPSKQALAISNELGKLQGLLLQDKA